MLKTEYPYNGREDRIKHYSDAGMYIEQTDTGRLYAEAVDKYPTPHEYEESDIPIEIMDGEQNA